MLRWIPCQKNKICEEEDKPELVIPKYQFTFSIEERNTPQYWYVLLLACTLNEQCEWVPSNRHYQLEYNIWLTNGKPDSNINTFSRQYSFEEQV